jgi:HlyD family secretion protein
MQIDTSVAEGDVGRLIEGMKARFTVDAFPGHTFEGVVRQIRNSATTVSGVVTYDAVIDVDNSQKEFTLRPGMTANVTFVLDEVANVVRIPNAALRFKPTPGQMAAMFGGDPSARGGRGRRGAGGSGSGSTGSGSGSSTGSGSGSGGSSGSGGGRHGGGATASADGSGSGAGGGDGSSAPDPTKKTVWKLENGKPKRVSVKVGLTDNSKTALVEGDLQPGDQLITAVTGAPAQASGGPGGGMRF